MWEKLKEYFKPAKHENFTLYVLLGISLILTFFYTSFLPVLLLIALVVGDISLKKNTAGNSNPPPAFLSFIFPFTYGFYVPICMILVRYFAIDGIMTIYNWYAITLFALITCIGSALFYFFILIVICIKKIGYRYAFIVRLVSFIICIFAWIGIFFVVKPFYKDLQDGVFNYQGSCKISYRSGGKGRVAYYSIKLSDNKWYIINDKTASWLYNKNGNCNYAVNVFYLQHAGVAFAAESSLQ